MRNETLTGTPVKTNYLVVLVIRPDKIIGVVYRLIDRTTGVKPSR